MSMLSQVQNRLNLLPRMSKAQLVALWKQSFGTLPPCKVRRDLLVRLLGYRIQEQAYGGLSPATRKALDEMARKFQSNPNAQFLAGC
jgi:hypothetical protein